MPCMERISSTCDDAGHTQSWKCNDGRPKICSKCERKAKLEKERQEQEIEAQKRREVEHLDQLAYLAAINAQIVRIKHAQAVEQKENDSTA